MAGHSDSEIEKLKEIITKYFDSEKSEVMQILLGCLATLAIKGTKKSIPCFLISPSSQGKSTILEIISSALEISGRIDSVHVDNFTPKAMVANSESDGLDLLEIIPGKCLMTTDLSVLFNRPPSQVKEFLATMVKILDSVGYSYASAKKINAYRDLNGHYHFIWLGAAITIPQQFLSNIFSTGLSTRFYYITMKKPDESAADIITRLTRTFTAKRDYLSRINITATAVAAFLVAIDLKIDSVNWGSDDPVYVNIISECAVILGLLRSQIDVISKGKNKKRYEINSESPERATSILLQFARGLAVIENKNTIQPNHLRLVTRFAIDSAAAYYPIRVLIFCKLIEENGAAIHLNEFSDMSKKYSGDWILAEVKNLQTIGFVEISNNKVKFSKEYEKIALDLIPYMKKIKNEITT